MEEIELNNDSWSLIAVVRECSRKFKLKAATTTATATVPTFGNGGGVTQPVKVAVDNCYFDGSFSDHSLGSSSTVVVGGSPPPCDELTNLYKSFLASSNSTSNAHVMGKYESVGVTVKPEPNSYHHRHNQQMFDISFFQQPPPSDQPVQRRSSQNRRISCSVGHRQNIHHKKNKYEERRVCRLSVEELSDDKWAWRKYGQKPIKGSPYPRNYYRCSSSKGCVARKQVERSPINPDIYVVTYTGNHFHPRPPPRNFGRGKRALPNSGPTIPPPAPVSGPDDHNGSGSGPEDHVVVTIEDDDDEEEDDYDHILIPNSMADPDLVMGMERLMKITNENGSDPVSGNGLDLGIQKIWDNETIIRSPTFLF